MSSYGKHVISIESLPLIKEVESYISKNKVNPIPNDFVSYEVTNPSLMIDWISLKFLFYSDEPLNGGNVISTNSEGEIEYTLDKKMGVEGSHDSKIYLRTERSNLPPIPQFENFWVLSVSGNPSKWFQGHNVFGSSDLPNLVIELFDSIAERFGKAQPQILRDAVLSGNYTISRVDINGMFELGSRADVLTWLSHCEKTARTRHGTALSKGTTVYFGKNSTRWTVKFYSKGQEIEEHKLPFELQETSIPKFANNKLRAELTLRGKELVKLGLNVGSSWFKLDVWSLYSEYLGRVEMSDQRITDDIASGLSRSVKLSYLLWKDGHCLKSELPKNTFYRHRRALLEHGVDISILKEKEVTANNVVPLRRVLELRPCGVPEWAKGTPMYFEPRKLSK